MIETHRFVVGSVYGAITKYAYDRTLAREACACCPYPPGSACAVRDRWRGQDSVPTWITRLMTSSCGVLQEAVSLVEAAAVGAPAQAVDVMEASRKEEAPSRKDEAASRKDEENLSERRPIISRRPLCWIRQTAPSRIGRRG